LSVDSGKWSIGDAGFFTVEVFNRSEKNSTIDLLTKKLGKPPDQAQTAQAAGTAKKPSTTIETTTWTLEQEVVSRVFTEPAKTFQIDVGPLLPLFESVVVFLVDNPMVPFLLLAIRGKIFGEKLDPTSLREPVRDQLRKLSLPFRLFVEKLPGLSSQNIGWSPHVANVTWVGLTVSQYRLIRIREVLSRLQNLRAAGPVANQLEEIIGELKTYQPLDMADPIVNITSHIAPYSNIHVIVSQSEQPGVSMYRALSVIFLVTEPASLNTYPEMRRILISMFPGAIDWAPSFFETALVWLVALNIWANNRLAVATNLDQAAMTFRRTPNVSSTANEIGKTLSEVSLVGTEAAVAAGEVSLTKRRAGAFLGKLATVDLLRPEINVSLAPYFLQDLVKYGENSGVVSSLSTMTREALEAAHEQLREIEGEVAAFQRHVSDIATLQSQEASTKLNGRIETLTKILVILTFVLAASAILPIYQLIMQFLKG